MKKFFVAASIAAVALGFASCDKGSSASNGSDGIAVNDSLPILMGEIQASRYLEMYNSMPDSIKAKFSKDEFISGMKAVLDRDMKDPDPYAIGMSMALQFSSEIARMDAAGVKFDKAQFLKSFASTFKMDSVNREDVMAKNASLQTIMMQVQDQMNKKQQAEQERMEKEAEAAAASNIKAGKEYVEQQKKADTSIKTTESGVSYKVVKDGSGTKPGKSDMVKVNYTGKHIDGSVFDSSNGTPRQFNVAGVVPGFGEILQMMAPGAKYVAYIPSDKAYGNRGAGDIKPGETLVFEIEMVEVNPAAGAK